MFKRFTLFFVCIACAGMLSASVKIGELYYNLSGTTATVTSNPNKYAGKIVIPDSVVYNDQKYAVKTIGESAFQSCSNLTAVTISEGVERINSYAFEYCSSLTSIAIPSSLNDISYWDVFYGCNSLQEVKISDLTAWCNINFYNSNANPLTYAHHLYLNNKEVTDLVIPEGITELKQFAFYNCTGIKSISFPEGFTTICYSALDQTGLISVDIPNTVTKIEKYAFSSCQSLESVTIPESVMLIENNAFQGCPKLQSIVLPSSITNISASLFYNCTGLKSITIPNTVEGIGSSAFEGCSSLSSITIPESVTSIGSRAFCNAGLTTIVLPNSLENIANEVFLNCNQLASVTIGTNVANIHSTAFNKCTKLNTIVWNATNFADFGNPTLSPFYTYRNNIASFTFGENITHIPAYLCYEMNNLSKIDIPASVTSVGEGAFAFCGRLTEINAATGSPLYTSIDGVLFNKEKTALIIYPAGKTAASYAVPNTVTRIEDNAFYGCTNLSSIEIPASVTEIGKGNSAIPMWSFAGASPAAIADENAFASDVYLIVDDVEVYKAAWPDYASRIFPRQYAEQNLTLTAKSDKSALHMAIGDANLENVIKLTISGTINSYDLMIMRNKMINLRELDLTEASIEANPYEYYTGICSHADTLLVHSFRGLVSLKLPKTLKYITGAVADCEKLKYLEINSGVVGPNIAASNSYEVVLNEGVTEIKADAFKGKAGLRKITIHAPITTIKANSFQDCTGLIEVILPATLETIEDYAFNRSGLLSVTIPANVKSIGKHAFSTYYNNGSNRSYYYDYYSGEIKEYTTWLKNSSSLAKLQFEPESKLQSIGSQAFYACPIDTLIMPDSVQTIGTYAFCNCRKLRCVSFSDESKLTSIGTGVFQQCASLDSLRLSASLKSIGTLAFSIHTDNVSTSNAAFDLILPEALETIGQGAFYGRTKMSKVAFPNTLKSVARDAFRKCEGLPNLSFPTSLQTIGDYAFKSCTGLEEIRVPSTLLSVGDYAFSDCSDVTKVYTYTVEPVSINQNTFSCWHNADLYVPTTSYYTYYYNTQWSQFLSLKQFDEPYEYFYINNDYELGGGNGTITGDPNADLNENSGLIVTGEDQQGMGVITIMGDGVNAGSIIACEENLSADSLIIRILTQKGKWNYFCFPFDILLKQLNFAHQYVIREYSGATRAEYGAGGWINMVGDMIHQGLGYIFQGAQTDTLEIVVPNPKISCQDYEQIVHAFGSDEAVHANWNFIGNPYPSWYDMDFLFISGYSSPIYIWDAGIQDYKVYKPGDDEYHFHPYEGFFTQNPVNTDMHILWGSAGRETKTQADEKQHGNHMPRKAARAARQQSDNRKLINLQLASETYSDRTRIVFNDAASMDYELGKDAVVMDGGQAPLHIWSLSGDKRLSINERPYATGQVSLGYYVQEEGFYTLSASRMDTAIIIFDNELSQEVDLSLGDYVFYTDAGANNTRFSIIRIKEQETHATAIEDVVDPEEQVSVYTLLGGKLYDNVRRADIQLNAGVYIIEKKNGARTELTIQ